MTSTEIQKAYWSVLESLKIDYEKSFNHSLNTQLLENKKDRIERVLENLNFPQNIYEQIKHEFFCYGPLADLLNDTSITEIIINNLGAVYIEKNGEIQNTDRQFISAHSYHNFVDTLSNDINTAITFDMPFVNGIWQGFRAHLVGQPVSDGIQITLRRLRSESWTFADLCEAQWATDEAFQILQKIVNEKKSFLIIGSTGSGKTSILNACLQLLPATERVISIEDTPEIRLPNSVSVQLVTRSHSTDELRAIDQAELLRQSLRMRPDRLIVGEVRGSEAKDFIMASATGHRGSACTLHADNPQQALSRLEMLVQMGAPQWSLDSIRKLIQHGLQFVIVVEKTNGKRRLNSIHRLASLENHGFCTEPIYELAHTI